MHANHREEIDEVNVEFVKGVGPSKELLFNNLGIYTVNDLDSIKNNIPVRV